MFNRTKVLAEIEEQRWLLEEQRCLIEQQQVEIQRQLRRIQLQAHLTAAIQTELDAIKLTLHPIPQQTPRNGNRGSNATRVVPIRETVSTGP